MNIYLPENVRKLPIVQKMANMLTKFNEEFDLPSEEKTEVEVDPVLDFINLYQYLALFDGVYRFDSNNYEINKGWNIYIYLKLDNGYSINQEEIEEAGWIFDEDRVAYRLTYRGNRVELVMKGHGFSIVGVEIENSMMTRQLEKDTIYIGGNKMVNTSEDYEDIYNFRRYEWSKLASYLAQNFYRVKGTKGVIDYLYQYKFIEPPSTISYIGKKLVVELSSDDPFLKKFFSSKEYTEKMKKFFRNLLYYEELSIKVDSLELSVDLNEGGIIAYDMLEYRFNRYPEQKDPENN